MRRLPFFLTLTPDIAGGRISFWNFAPQRGLKFQIDMKWVIPDRKTIQHPVNSGDLSALPSYKKETILADFQNSQELKNCSENVRKLFSLQYHHPVNQGFLYREELINKVKRHQYDTNSLEVKIASKTAFIRFLQAKLETLKRDQRDFLKYLVNKRKEELTMLRLMDYKKFEWLLEQLDLEYKPDVEGDKTVTRKKSLTLLVKLKTEQLKEAKLGAHKKELDKHKVPFLEKKLQKLKWIKEMEEKNNLTQTVTEEDIEKCIQTLEKVKVEVAERIKNGYVRKIHPYFLEPYEEEEKKESSKK